MLNAKLSDNYKNVKFNTLGYRIFASFYVKWIELSSWFLAKKNNFGENERLYLQKIKWSQFLSGKFMSESELLCHKSIEEHAFKKKSDTLYILGCGKSINSVTSAEWAEISKYDSIGLNFFFVQKFLPSIYMVEVNHTPEMLDLMYSELFDKKNKVPTYINIQHILRTKEIGRSAELDARIKANAYYFSPTYANLPTENNEPLAKFILDKYYGKLLLNNSSNLDAAICMAYRFGYKKIKLVGVDLDDNKHFWDVPEEKQYDSYLYSAARNAFSVAKKELLDKEGFELKKDVHLTEDKEHLAKLHKIPISEYLNLVCKNIFNNEGVSLSVCNSQSKLVHVLPFTPILSSESRMY